MISEILLCDFKLPQAKFKLASQTRLVHDGTMSSAENKYKSAWRIIQQQAFLSSTPEPRLQPDWSTFVTWFDPALTSMQLGRLTRSRRDFRLLGISQKDNDIKRTEVDGVLERREDVHGTGIDWQIVARNVIEFYSPELVKLLRALRHVQTQSSSLSLFALADDALFVQQALLIPYTSHFDNQLDPDQQAKRQFQRCRRDFIPDLDFSAATPQERLIINSIEAVLDRLCTFSLALDPRALLSDIAIDTLYEDIVGLLDWLDWEIEKECNSTCAYDVGFLPRVAYQALTETCRSSVSSQS